MFPRRLLHLIEVPVKQFQYDRRQCLLIRVELIIPSYYSLREPCKSSSLSFPLPTASMAILRYWSLAILVTMYSGPCRTAVPPGHCHGQTFVLPQKCLDVLLLLIHPNRAECPILYPEPDKCLCLFPLCYGFPLPGQGPLFHAFCFNGYGYTPTSSFSMGIALMSAARYHSIFNPPNRPDTASPCIRSSFPAIAVSISQGQMLHILP